MWDKVITCPVCQVRIGLKENVLVDEMWTLFHEECYPYYRSSAMLFGSLDWIIKSNPKIFPKKDAKLFHRLERRKMH